MPLIKSGSKEAISENIRTEMAAKKPQRQAIAIALSVARRARGRAMGGPVQMTMPQQGVGMQSGMMPQGMPGSNPAMGMVPQGASPMAMGQLTGANPMAPPAMGMPQPNMNMGVMPQAMAPAGSNPANMGAPMPQMGVPPNLMGRPMMAAGGGVGSFNMAQSPHLATPWQAKSEARQMVKGPLLSAVPGRTDAHRAKVSSSSYVIPADVVSGLGQGNTIAGANRLDHMFKGSPYEGGAVGMHMGAGAPKPPRVGKFADGGSTDPHIGTPTDVDLAGGEYVVEPRDLMRVVHPDVGRAHEIMDSWILHERKKLVNTLKNLPGPVKD